jgi:N-acetylmuramoyl-L-alanine amidase
MQVYLTRDRDINVDLRPRTDMANKLPADLLVSVHLNGHPDPAVGGTETFYKAGNNNGKKLAEFLQVEMLAEFRLRNRGVKTSNLHMTRESKMPAALTEAAFISNVAEAALMKRPDFDQRHGQAIARGIIKYIEWVRLVNPVVVLDAGHGGTSTGAAANGVVEKHRVLAACMFAMKALKEHGGKAQADPLKDAVDFFVQSGVISSPDYWLQNAVAGRMVKGENVAAFVIKAAERFMK